MRPLTYERQPLNPTVAFGSAEVLLGWRDNQLNANGDTQVVAPVPIALEVINEFV